MIVFVATALFISWLSGGQKRAKESLRQARDQLDAKVRERTAELKGKEQPSGSIVVLVQDSGVGVDPKHSSRMFEAFYTTKVEGIGMGLTISRSIVEAHGGRIWAVANDGPGSTFCLTLPIDKGAKV
jgi:signal transduction histidine kinase